MTFQKLIHLIYENDITRLRIYKKNGIDFSMIDSHTKGNLLISYSSYGYEENYTQTEMINFLLESGIDVNYKLNERGNRKSALHKAVGNGHFEIVKALIENGANLDIKDTNGNTPLWNAVMMYRGSEQEIKIIRYLISKGSSLDIKNNQAISPKDIINNTGSGIDRGYNQKDLDLRFLLS
ncbi:MAG: ankyrin repeat domain-containing protein [Saprospiraceae bacterium]